MSRTAAYMRVSTSYQDFHRQAPVTEKVDVAFFDKFSGKTTEGREGLKSCLEWLQKGDTLLVWEMWRLGRSVPDVRRICEGLIDRGISIKFVSEGLFLSAEDTGMAKHFSNLVLTVMSACGEFDRAYKAESSRQGLEYVKKNHPEKLRKTAGSKWREKYFANKAAGKHSTTKLFKPSPKKEKLIVDIETAISYSSPKTFVELADKLNQNGVMTLSNKVWDGKSLAVFAKRNEIKL